MPRCKVCYRDFVPKRPSRMKARFCSGRCRARASRERRARKVRERLEQAGAAILEAKEILEVTPRGRPPEKTPSEH